jgi:hypothetical protein
MAVKHITFYLDFASPECDAAFSALPEALMGLSYSVSYIADTVSLNRYECELRFRSVSHLAAEGTSKPPSFTVDGHLFSGSNVLHLLHQYLHNTTTV